MGAGRQPAEANAAHDGGRMKKKEPACPNCGNRLECDPDQDGSCDWSRLNCGWHQHVPAPQQGRKPERTERKVHAR